MSEVREFETFRLGPTIMKTTISDNSHTILLNVANKVRKNKKLKVENDYRRSLAGNLAEEYAFRNAFSEKAKKIVEDRKEEEQPDIEVLEMDVDSIFTAEEIADMEIQIDNMNFDDLVDLGMYDENELEYIDVEDEDDIQQQINYQR